ncbi:MAG: hypothetical protein ACR2IS_17140 [Nitrososphaeraceae archaeon]
MNSTITTIQQKNNIQKNEGETYAYLIHGYNCYAAVIISPPKAGHDMILTEPCPMCDGSEQSFSCDYCYQKNTIYWDQRHFVEK